MRDIISCFSENAVNVSPCSSYSSAACISPNLIPSIQTAITSLYKITLSSQKQILITITWCKNQGLAIDFGHDTSTSFKLNTYSRLFRKKKGNKFMESDDSKIEIFWDLSSAKYESSPEPDSEFYILILVDSEICIHLGSMAEEVVKKKFKSNHPIAKMCLISRKEHFSGNTLYSTKAQFSENGIGHEIMIKCSGENEGLKYPVLSVCIDAKMVIRVKRLQWNFRGNQTIFVDGLLVDLMWDVHDWFHNSVNGFGVFMFRTRSGFDSRLWLEENLLKKEQQNLEFSLLIYACKNP